MSDMLDGPGSFTYPAILTLNEVEAKVALISDPKDKKKVRDYLMKLTKEFDLSEILAGEEK
jgi:hypothetical protein